MSTRSRNPGILLAIALALILVPGEAAAFQGCNVDIEFQDVTVSGGDVLLVSRGRSRDPRIDEQAIEDLPFARTDDGKFRVYVDVENIREDRQRFRYEFYVQWTAVDVQCSPRLVNVQGVAKGVFNPQQTLVSFTVVDGDGGSAGTFENLPVYNLRNADDHFLQPTDTSEITRLGVGRATPLSIGLKNNLVGLPVEIVDVQVDLGTPAYWVDQSEWDARYNVEVHVTEFEGGDNSEEAIELSLRPSVINVLWDTIIPSTAQDQPHEVVHVRVDYTTNSVVGGQLEIPVNIRFRPSGLSLFFAVIMGALLGGTIKLALRKSGSELAWWKVLTLSALLAIVAEIFGIVLVQSGSEFRLLSISLDPVELLPAGLLGVIIGLSRFTKLEKFLATMGVEGEESE